ncbi:hypothetical protein BJ165DRAFT_1403665 [Panaeolus papilionaceus]|nr:hypothetical protein BJ165DRAFT_1403665 [Panaeolus papilionaceus]
MEDPRATRFAIFCIADIPMITFNKLVEEAFGYMSPSEQAMLSDVGLGPQEAFVLITSTDITTIRHGLTLPVTPFVSPFKGKTIQEMSAWFSENVCPVGEDGGYNSELFVVLDAEAVEDHICTIVSIMEGFVQTLRVDFALLLTTLFSLNTFNATIDEGPIGAFHRTGIAMTKDNFELVLNGGMYLDGMEVKIDEAWRDFSRS